ncbi:hypothetical protein B1R94_02880 [Mycolicibacterium litorale]|nr:hypothetical protein B1R94_02880 [Mycolicibacterium litorale]
MLAAACADSGSTSEPHREAPRWPTLMSDLHFAWSAEPGIDLFSGAAVVIRAYQESLTAAAYGGNNEYLYPGFDNAVAPNQPQGSPRSTRALWPELGFPLERPLVGTFRNHILHVNTAGPNTSVTVCDWLWGAARQQPDGKFLSGTSWRAAPGVSVSRYTLATPPSTDSTAQQPQRGPSLFAINNVFGKWRVIGRITATDSIAAGPEWPEFDQDLAACAAKAPESEERRQFLTTGEHPRSDFPTLPAYPGWPAESQ